MNIGAAMLKLYRKGTYNPRMGQACSCACKSARRQAWTIGVGLALALGAEIAEWLGLEGVLPIALAGAAILLAGRGVLWQGLHALVRLRPNIYLLMTLASAGALALDKWGEAAVVLALYALAELLEQRASERSEQQPTRCAPNRPRPSNSADRRPHLAHRARRADSRRAARAH
jgi:cation transport ATPase